MSKPLRDALRGVAMLADRAEDALEPAAQLLPEPLRNSVKSALDALEVAGTSLISASVETSDIAVASDVLIGRTNDADGLATCASVIAFAFERLADHPLVSETLLSSQLASRGPVSGETPGERAAALLINIRSSSAIGEMPGMNRPRSDEDQRGVDQALFSTMVWLLAAREDGLEGEVKLLDLSTALVTAMEGEISDLFDQPDQLARHLQTVATHL